MNIKKWFNQRSLSKTHTNTYPQLGELYNYIQLQYSVQSADYFADKLYGALDEIVKAEISSQIRSKNKIKIIEALINRSKIIEKSSTIDTLIQSKIEESISRLKSISISERELIKMAVPSADIAKIVRSSDQDQAHLVNTEWHMLEHKPDTGYLKALDSDKPMIKAPSRDVEGVSPKIVHDILVQGQGITRYMAKPYFQKIGSGTPYVKRPYLGWSTIATKELFNSAGIGNLCEEVSAHKIDDIPVTVHKFNKNFTTVYNKRLHDKKRVAEQNYNFDHDDVFKIGVMDFLSNNLDRHSGNILIPYEPNTAELKDQTWHPIVAIDHDRNFQYNKGRNQWKHGGANEEFTAQTRGDHLLDYIHNSSLAPLWDSRYTNYSYISDWWKEYSPKIQEAMNKNINMLQDEDDRDHVRSNFQQRFNWMNEWVDGMEENLNFRTESLSEKNGIHMYKPTRTDQIKKLTSKLPSNPIDAIDSIAKWALKNKKAKPLSFLQQFTIKHAMKEILNKTSDQDLINLYEHVQKTPTYNSLIENHNSKVVHPPTFLSLYLYDDAPKSVTDKLLIYLKNKENKTHFDKMNIHWLDQKAIA